MARLRADSPAVRLRASSSGTPWTRSGVGVGFGDRTTMQPVALGQAKALVLIVNKCPDPIPVEVGGLGLKM